MKSLIYILSCFLVLVSTLYSKKEYNTWHLEIDDTFNSISFNSPDGNIVFKKDNFFDLFNLNNSSVISDSTGQPYFSTNGYHYWNVLKEKISISDSNCFLGDGPLDWGATSFAFKVPGNTQQYYIITPWTGCGSTLSSNGLRYAMVDFSLNPSGDVIYKNKMLNEYINSDVGVTYHANKRDVWIVVKDSSKNIFRSYLAKDNGIKLTNTSKIKISSDNCLEFGVNWSLGNLKLANQGDILAFCHFGMNPSNYFKEGKLILSKFNNITGAISNPIEIDKSLIGFPVSVEISPNSRYIYVTTCDTSWFASPGNITKKISSIYQLDVSVWDSMTIANSITPLYKAISSNDRDRPDTLLGQLQLGPNGKIYLLEEIWIGNAEYTYHISSIDRPNQKGLSSNFLQNFKIYGTSNHRTGLPKCLFKSLLTITVRGDTVCEGNLLKVTSSVESEVDGYKYFWSGPNGFSSTDANLVFQKAMSSMAGWYKLKVTLNDLEASDSVFVKVYSKPNIRFEPNNPVHFCQGDSTTIKAVSDSLIVTYKWSTGAKTQSITVKNGGYYSVILTDINGCINKDSILVIVDSLPKVKILPEGAKNFCLGDSVVLKATPDNLDFVWSTGEKTKFISVKQSGMYYVEGTNQSGCKANDSIIVTVLPNLEPKINLDGNNPNCEGDSIRLSSSFSGSEYKLLWSTGDTSESIIVKLSGRYKLKVSLGGSCEGEDSIDVIFNPIPTVKISGSTSFCKGDTIILSANNDFNQYKWSTGETTKSIKVNSDGKYGLKVINGYGCIAYDTIDVKLVSLDFDFSNLGYDFGRVLMNGDSAYKYTYTNTTSATISISDAKLNNNDGIFYLKANPSLPVTLPPGGKLEFTLTFSPTELKGYNNQLTIKIDKPCPIEYTYDLKGIGYMRLYIWLPDTTGEVGTSNYGISMKAFPLSIIKAPITIPYNSGINWYSDNYIADSVHPAKIITNNTEDSRQSLEISGSFELKPEGYSLVTNIFGTILLSDKRITPLKFKDFKTGNDLIEVVTKDGSLTTTGVCAWNLRQIIFRDMPQIIVSPNPAEEYFEILLKGDKNYPCILKIYSINGNIVFTKTGSFEKKELSIKINTADYISGIYVIQVWLSGEFITKQFMIMK